MTQFVNQQNAEERHGERPARDEIPPARTRQPLEKATAPITTPTSPGGSVGVQVPARAAPAPRAQITVTPNRKTWSSQRSPRSVPSDRIRTRCEWSASAQ
jgi:hypothetical protein